jgi:GxxExxY protein
MITNQFIRRSMSALIYKAESYRLIGLAMEVHNSLGPGFLEAVYQEALEIELRKNNIPYQRETPLIIYYKGIQLQRGYKADFVCYNKIIIELKALDALNSCHEAQVINYLKATKFKLGLLINFGESKLNCKRLINELC